ncbi:MAG TPA: hypothetical protein ENI81_08860 [Phycisphaerales bacterium]|nr:hypothetical protein [Phycisphaerales bacterium]
MFDIIGPRGEVSLEKPVDFWHAVPFGMPSHPSAESQGAQDPAAKSGKLIFHSFCENRKHEEIKKICIFCLHTQSDDVKIEN